MADLSGFTLFHHRGKGWQMSTQRKGETGWSITFIPEEQAAVVLSMLDTRGSGPVTIAAEGVGRLFAGLQAELYCRHGRRLNQDCFACDEDAGSNVIAAIAALGEAARHLAEAFK